MKGIRLALKVNVDDEPKLAQEYDISRVPALKFFCAGREIGEMIGGLPKGKLEAHPGEVDRAARGFAPRRPHRRSVSDHGRGRQGRGPPSL